MPTDKSEAGVRAAFEAEYVEDVSAVRWDWSCGFPLLSIGDSRETISFELEWDAWQRAWRTVLATSAADSARLDYLERRGRFLTAWTRQRGRDDWIGNIRVSTDRLIQMKDKSVREGLDAAMQAEEQQRD